MKDKKTKAQKRKEKRIKEAVDRAIKEYGSVLKKLGES